MTRKIICPECDGHGVTIHYAMDSLGNKLKMIDMKCTKCNGTGIIDVIYTNYDFVQSLNIDDMAKFCALNRAPYLPHSACYICEYWDGPECTKKSPCSEQDQINIYKQWLAEEYKGD